MEIKLVRKHIIFKGRVQAVSYTHLDVYKRQVITPPEWSSKAVAPGDTLTFTFKSGKGTASLSNIQSVTLRQKAVSSGSIISRNVLYENNESGVVETTTEKVTTTKRCV